MQWRYQETVLTLCTLAFFVTMVGRLAISPVLPQIVSTFAVSKTHIGLSLTGMWLTYGLVQYPSGVLADQYGERRIIIIAIGGSALAGLALSVTPIFPLFLLMTVLFGAVSGLHYSVATTLLARTYENVGTAIGVHHSGATVAGLLTPVVVAWLAIRFGWRPAIAVVTVVGIPAALLFAEKVRPVEPRRPEGRIRDRFQFSEARELLLRPPIAFSLIIALVGEFTWQGTASFLPSFLMEYQGMSTTLAGSFFSLYFVIQGVAQVAIGAISDQFGRDQTIAGCMLAGGLGIGVLLAIPGFLSVFLGITLFGVAMSFGAALTPRFFREFSAEEENTGFGLVRSVYMIIASLGSVVVGLLADLFGWMISFGFLGFLLLIVSAMVILNKLFQLGY